MRTKKVILVTADGLRLQELFTGIDPLLMNEASTGMSKAPELRKELWDETPEARRQKLMPFFWTVLAPKGVVLGNPAKNSSVRVSNAFRVSYPGYSEILTGRAQDEIIRGNDKIQNPSQTVLEFVRQALGVGRDKVALFSSWDVFPYIGESKPGSIHVDSGYQAETGSNRALELSSLQFRARTPWDSVRHDYVTLELALDYLIRESPVLTYISLGESDDWAHERRYDRTLQAIQYFDQALKQIWYFIRENPEYRDQTSLIVTVDHGRGATLEDWHGHGKDVPGADRIWIAVFGPDTPSLGEAANSEGVMQRDVAPTLLSLLGIDYREYTGVQGKPINLVRGRPSK